AAQRSFLQSAAHQPSLRHKQVIAGEDGELHTRRDGGVGLDVAGDQLLEQRAALAVADQDEWATAVPGREIGAPRGGDVAVGEPGSFADVPARGLHTTL